MRLGAGTTTCSEKKTLTFREERNETVGWPSPRLPLLISRHARVGMTSFWRQHTSPAVCVAAMALLAPELVAILLLAFALRSLASRAPLIERVSY